LARLAAEPIPKEIRTYSLPVPLHRVIGVATLTNAFHIPSVFAFLELLGQFDFQRLAQHLTPAEAEIPIKNIASDPAAF
jgi:hypothetical protein